VAIALMIAGGIVMLVGWVWILIAGFSESVPWGVGIFCLSPLALVYGILKWDELKVPTVLYAGGGLVHLIGRLL
jgi:hypothetical protein